jgi:hypothetical protein
LIARWPRRRIAQAHCFQCQYGHLLRQAGDNSLVFCQVGRFIEFYGPQRVAAVQALGLRPVARPRAGYAFTAGFPVHLSSRYTVCALWQGLMVVEVHQAPALLQQGRISRLPYAL